MLYTPYKTGPYPAEPRTTTTLADLSCCYGPALLRGAEQCAFPAVVANMSAFAHDRLQNGKPGLRLSLSEEDLLPEGYSWLTPLFSCAPLLWRLSVFAAPVP